MIMAEIMTSTLPAMGMGFSFPHIPYAEHLQALEAVREAVRKDAENCPGPVERVIDVTKESYIQK